MEEFNELKNIWNKQQVPSYAYEAFLKAAKLYAKKEKFKSLKANILLLLTSVIIAAIWWYYQPTYTSTKIGIIIVILTMIIYLVYFNEAYRTLRKPSEEIETKQFLNQLLMFKEKQKVLQTKGINLYLFFIYLGLNLYMYEYLSRMSLLGILITYSIVTAWFVVNWFFFKPRIIKKQNRKLNQVIEGLQKVEHQLK